MSANLDGKLARQMIEMLQRDGAGSPGAAAMIGLLEKVATPPAGARVTDLSTQAYGLVARIGQAVRYVVQNVTPSTWFGPGQPIAAQADKPEQGTKGRVFDYATGINLSTQPRSEQWAGGVSFPVLRALADSFDLLRLVIETRKDQIASISWEVIPEDGDAEEDKYQEQIEKVTAFFKRPTPKHTWLEWIRLVVEDDLVLGSVALYPWKTRGGDLYALYPVDASMFKLVVDAYGMTPEPPSPAYQQNLKGLPVVDLAADELEYWIRNPRTWKLYGYSPVEQVIITVNIAMRRQAFLLEYYTEGNIPDAIIGVPDTWSPDQIKEFQDWWDSILSGNTAVRRKIRFMPETKGVLLPKDAKEILTDNTDEWLARIICFAFSIAPTALVKMVNRASSQQIAEAAREEGLLPVLNWYAERFTRIANEQLGCPGVKFAWKIQEEIDPAAAATIRKSDVSVGIVSVDEAREDLGLPPIGVGNVVITMSGPVPLKEGVDDAIDKIKNPPKPGEPGGPPLLAGPGVAQDAPPSGKGAPAGAKSGTGPADKVEVHVHNAQPDILINVDVRDELAKRKVA